MTQSLFFCISVLLQVKNVFRLSLWRLAQGSEDAATVCQTTFVSWLQARRPLLKEGMWKGHLHPSYMLGLLLVSLGFFKLRFLRLQLWLNRGPMDSLKKDGGLVLGFEFCSTHANVSFKLTIQILQDNGRQKSMCPCSAMSSLLARFSPDLALSIKQRIWSVFKGPLMHLNSSEGRANMQHETQFW